jgi:hypothetical protein
MTTYYKIPRNSETGRKFEALDSRCKEVREKIAVIGEKYGFGHDYYTRGENAAGGVVAVCFHEGKTATGEEVDMKLWRNGECGYGTYAPRLKGEGRQIREALNACGEVTRYEYNEVMGVGDIFHFIGVDCNDKFYVVAMNKSKSSGIPADAVEITASEFSAISGSEED